jgi:hypothetical protein|tara:strand:- start:30691 stop:31320 length:630 start_codon:yes stop_codon:yes gene_type:complete
MSHDITIQDRSFIGQPNLEHKHDNSALGFSWRPGRKKQSILIKNCKIDANGASEGLKLSWCRDVLVENCTIIGGYEDCVDIVKGRDITFRNCKFIAKNTKHHFTIKCMASNIIIKDCEFINNFNHVYDGACVDMGNWSLYDTEDLKKTQGVIIQNCSLKNMSWYKKILTRRIYAKSAIIKQTSGFNLKIPRLFVKIFWAFKRCQAKKKT